MATAPTIRNVAPCVLNGTTLPVMTWGKPNQFQPQALRHSGFEFPADYGFLVAGQPVSIVTPLRNALDLVGINGLAVTALALHAGRMGDLVRSTAGSSVHSQWTLGGSGTIGKAFIRPFTVAQDQIALAEIIVIPFADFTRTDTDTLPTPATPLWHTLGNFTHGGTDTVLPGVQQATVDLGLEPNIIRSDGQQFPVDAKLMVREGGISVQTEDTIAVANALTEGAETLATTLKVWFRSHNPATGLHLSTGFALTIATGEAKVLGPPADIPGEDQALQGTVEIRGISPGSGSHYLTLGANGTALPE